VFTVLGAYAFTTGLFVAHIAFTALRSGRKMPAALIAGAGLTSLGVMVVVNFAIGSDFKYLLAGLGALWAIAVLLVFADRTSAR
jgi:kynureninase